MRLVRDWNAVGVPAVGVLSQGPGDEAAPEASTRRAGSLARQRAELRKGALLAGRRSRSQRQGCERAGAARQARCRRKVVRRFDGHWRAVRVDQVQEGADPLGGIADGRIRRKYNSIPRYTYEEITPLLVRDNALTAAEAEVVNDMDRTFRSLRNRKTPVTPERVREFQGWRARVGG